MDKAIYFALLRDSIRNTLACGPAGNAAAAAELDLGLSLEAMRADFDRATRLGRKVIFIGNGGSNAIASHMASDICKNGGVRAIAFNDSSALTMLGNDFGYEMVFSKQIEFHGLPGDLLVAISSSGGSSNILAAARRALLMGLELYTFTGAVRSAENTLRGLGKLNFIVPCTDYGIVELSHASLIHSVI